MIAINRTKLQEVIAGYKKYFPEHISDELYKWKAVKHFQDKWDIDAQDFAAMFWEATSKFDNLLTTAKTFPRLMVKEMCNSEPEMVREMFRDLYDESKPLGERVKNFQAIADHIQRQHWPGKMHYQNLNAISTYLWARYPDKYYIYKYTEIRTNTISISIRRFGQQHALWTAMRSRRVPTLPYFCNPSSSLTCSERRSRTIPTSVRCSTLS